MCAPTTTDVLRRCQRTALKVPSDILVEIGSAASQSPTQSSKRQINDIIKTALLLGACFAVIMLQRNHLPSAVMGRIKDLKSLDQLKKELVDDELEVRWDRQHIRELEESMHSLEGSFTGLTREFHEEEMGLFNKSQTLKEALAETSELEWKAQEFDRDLYLKLVEEAELVGSSLEREARENAVLKKLLANTVREMQEENIPLPQAALRGSS